ncbi:MAG: hypothetical protein QOI66_3682, partial [Myxococcales bacterium]|nr:hypothetical protein [Myxococcales bacterium]
MNLSSNWMAASFETAIPGGFRRTSTWPPSTAAIRVRDQLVAAAHGRPEHVVRGLASLRHWRCLLPLLQGPWFGELARASGAARWTIERKLTILGTPLISIAEAQAAPVGTPVRLNGVVRFLRIPGGAPLSDIGPIWENSTQGVPAAGLFIEEGHDFLLDSGAGTIAGSVAVLSQGGQLIDGDRVEEGDSVEILGFVDRVVDPAAPPAA